jgi:hypothetical protein
MRREVLLDVMLTCGAGRCVLCTYAHMGGRGRARGRPCPSRRRCNADTFRLNHPAPIQAHAQNFALASPALHAPAQRPRAEAACGAERSRRAWGHGARRRRRARRRGASQAAAARRAEPVILVGGRRRRRRAAAAGALGLQECVRCGAAACAARRTRQQLACAAAHAPGGRSPNGVCVFPARVCVLRCSAPALAQALLLTWRESTARRGQPPSTPRLRRRWRPRCAQAERRCRQRSGRRLRRARAQRAACRAAQRRRSAPHRARSVHAHAAAAPRRCVSAPCSLRTR